MCAQHDCSCITLFENLLNQEQPTQILPMHSGKISSNLPSECDNMKPSKACDEHVYSNTVNVSADTQNLYDKSIHSNVKKSLYMSKSYKYSFIASDYTSPEGQKLLSIKVYQKPPGTDTAASKSKTSLSKRSISEYFLSKNGSDRDMLDEKGKDNLLKSWQKNSVKPPSRIINSFEDSSNCDKASACVQDTERETTFNISSINDQCVPSHKSSFSLQAQTHNLSVLDSEPGASGINNESQDEKASDVGGSEDKYAIKNCNLNPNVNFKVFDIESLSESGEPCDNGSLENNVHFGIDDAWFIPSARHTFSGTDISGSASAAQLSIASSFGDSSLPICKICHTAAKPDDPLISPCRCTGTLRYIHCGCLMKWLEICNKRSRKPPTCELCKYQFHWHKKFKVGQWQFPHCSWQDKILHSVFFISVLIMIGCAVVTVMCFKQHRGSKSDITHLELTQSEIITLICGALFFLAFFLAMYVEIKARNTIYKLMLKFIYLNQQWYIDEYDKKKENSAIDV